MTDYSFLQQQPQQTVGQPMLIMPAANQVQQSPQIGAISMIPANAITTQNSGGIADALMSGAADPVGTGNQNASNPLGKLGGVPGLTSILSMLGTAMSAKNPTSWQYMLSQGMGKVAATQSLNRANLIAALQQKIKAPTPTSSLTPQLGANTPTMNAMYPKAEYTLEGF